MDIFNICVVISVLTAACFCAMLNTMIQQAADKSGERFESRAVGVVSVLATAVAIWNASHQISWFVAFAYIAGILTVLSILDYKKPVFTFYLLRRASLILACGLLVLFFFQENAEPNAPSFVGLGCLLLFTTTTAGQYRMAIITARAKRLNDAKTKVD